MNEKAVIDPFKNMKYDPELCYNLRKDYYFFGVEFKRKNIINLALDGFFLNYNQENRTDLNLRSERGKVTFLVYNGNFWSSYKGFDKFKGKHWCLMLSTLLSFIISNVLLYIFLT